MKLITRLLIALSIQFISTADAVKAIDDNPDTFWATSEGAKTAQEVIIDYGKSIR